MFFAAVNGLETDGECGVMNLWTWNGIFGIVNVHDHGFYYMLFY